MYVWFTLKSANIQKVSKLGLREKLRFHKSLKKLGPREKLLCTDVSENWDNTKNHSYIKKPQKKEAIAKSAANQRKFKLQDLKNGGFREKYYTSAKIQGTVT